MKLAVIFSGAPVDASLQPPVPKADYYICADAGVSLAHELGIVPDWIVGDFDSLGYVPTGEHVMAYATEKDDTDTALAIRYALSKGCQTILCYGALGGRLDHTFANLQMLRMLSRQGVQGILVDATHWISVQNPGTVRYERKDGYYFSLFSLTEQCTGVTLMGVKYPLNDAILYDTDPLGVSNEIIADVATVTITTGELLVIYAKDSE